MIGFVFFLVDAPDGEPDDGVYFSGDTVWFEGVAGVAQRFKPGVAILNLGAARVPEVGPFHLTSDEGLDYESLVDLLLRAKFRWILSGYPHPLLCRLGKPFWARDVRFLCVRNTYHQEERTECLWTNFVPGETKRRHLLPPSAADKGGGCCPMLPLCPFPRWTPRSKQVCRRSQTTGTRSYRICWK